MSEEKLRILKMLESGLISAEEAVKLIEALDKTSDVKSESASQSEPSYKGIGGLFEELDKLGQKLTRQRPTADTMNQSKDKMFDFFQSAMQRIKDAEVPFVGKGTEFTHTFQEQASDPTYLKIETANGAVSIRTWDGNGVKIECAVKVYGTADEEEARQSFLKNSVFYARENKLSFSAGLRLMKTDVTVYVPSAELEEVSVKVFNGSFDFRDITAGKLDVRSGNGKIEVKNSRFGTLDAETGNGPVRIIDCDGERAALNTFNGAIHMVGTFQFTDLQTFNGNVLYDAKTNRAEALRVESMTGSIEMYVPKELPVKGEMRTTAGRFTLPETGIANISEKDERIQKTLKFESDPLTEGPRLVIDAETKTGSISLRVSSLRQTPSEDPEIDPGI